MTRAKIIKNLNEWQRKKRVQKKETQGSRENSLLKVETEAPPQDNKSLRTSQMD